MFKIYNGTPTSTDNICRTCSNGTVIQGVKDSDQRTHCSYLSGPISFPVSRCTSYHETGTRSLSQFYKDAWIINGDKKKGLIGFKRIAEMTREEKMDQDLYGF